MFSPEYLLQMLIAAPAILFSLTVHEFFHAWTAYRFGDKTAYYAGRLTLNPLPHLDFLGTITAFLSGFRFGWAKPVPVNPMNFTHPRVADFWVSFAGPLSNLGLGFLFGLVIRIIVAGSIAVPPAVGEFLRIGVILNVSLALFNLIPLYPLDGSHMLRNLLPVEAEAGYDRFQRMAPMILLFLIVAPFLLRTFNPLWMILGPFVSFFVRLFAGYPV
jgi:Zn-dependent protease